MYNLWPNLWSCDHQRRVATYHAKCAKALLASAILWVSIFFFIATPVLLNALMISAARITDACAPVKIVKNTTPAAENQKATGRRKKRRKNQEIIVAIIVML